MLRRVCPCGGERTPPARNCRAHRVVVCSGTVGARQRGQRASASAAGALPGLQGDPCGAAGASPGALLSGRGGPLAGAPGGGGWALAPGRRRQRRAARGHRARVGGSGPTPRGCARWVLGRPRVTTSRSSRSFLGTIRWPTRLRPWAGLRGLCGSAGGVGVAALWSIPGN